MLCVIRRTCELNVPSQNNVHRHLLNLHLYSCVCQSISVRRINDDDDDDDDDKQGQGQGQTAYKDSSVTAVLVHSSLGSLRVHYMSPFMTVSIRRICEPQSLRDAHCIFCNNS